MTTWIKIPQLVEMIGMSKETIYRMVKKNGIPHYRVGKMILFDIDEINEWIKEKKANNT